MAEVKSQVFPCNLGACLVYVVSEDFLKSLVQKMCCSMVSRNIVSYCEINCCLNLVTCF